MSTLAARGFLIQTLSRLNPAEQDFCKSVEVYARTGAGPMLNMRRLVIDEKRLIGTTTYGTEIAFLTDDIIGFGIKPDHSVCATHKVEPTVEAIFAHLGHRDNADRARERMTNAMKAAA
jgi:hypothetical protein